MLVKTAGDEAHTFLEMVREGEAVVASYQRAIIESQHSRAVNHFMLAREVCRSGLVAVNIDDGCGRIGVEAHNGEGFDFLAHQRVTEDAVVEFVAVVAAAVLEDQHQRAIDARQVANIAEQRIRAQLVYVAIEFGLQVVGQVTALVGPGGDEFEDLFETLGRAVTVDAYHGLVVLVEEQNRRGRRDLQNFRQLLFANRDFLAKGDFTVAAHVDCDGVEMLPDIRG